MTDPGPEEMRLRDHTRPCEHGRLWAHWEGARPKWWQEPDCPGGAEVVLRRLPDGSWEEQRPGSG